MAEAAGNINWDEDQGFALTWNPPQLIEAQPHCPAEFIVQQSLVMVVVEHHISEENGTVPSKGCCHVNQSIVRLGGASVNYYLKVGYGISNSLCLVSWPNYHRAAFRRDELYGRYRGL